MASTEALQYFPSSAGGLGLGSYHSTEHLARKQAEATSPSSFLGSLIPPPKLGVIHPQSPTSYTSTYDPYRLGTYSSGSSGAVHAAKVESNHAKNHKRAAKGKNNIESEQSHNALTRTMTPEPGALPSPIDGSKSPSSRSLTREKLRQNLRKLSQYPEDIEPSDTVDLSRTAAENEARLGLGISAPRLSSKSVPDMASAANQRYRHGRSLSHESQASTVAGPYQPTVPFIHPMREAARPFTPLLTRSQTESFTSEDPAQKDISRSRGVTVNSLSSLTERPQLRLNTSGSATHFSNNSQSILAPATSFTRPRRSTNQSVISTDIATPRSNTSGDRAFSFRSKAKDEPIDAYTRAANIQVARQAFEDRQTAKARKYEEQEQKALERQNKKQSKQEGRSRALSDAVTSTFSLPTTFRSSSPWREKTGFISGGDYASTKPTTQVQDHPLRGQGIPGLREEKVSRKRAAKGRYYRFVTWLKTKFLNMGRKRRGAVRRSSF